MSDLKEPIASSLKDDVKDSVQASTPVKEDGLILTQNWSEQEEKRARLKVDFIILPLLIMGFSALQLDRGNISNALTSTIREDLGINQDVINNGNQLLSVAIVIFEIPANILLQKVGPSRWLSGQIFCWGMVALFQSFCTNKSTWFFCRFLLGTFEAGYIPGSLFILSTWYRRSEISSRSALFFLGNLGTAALSGLLAAGILNLEGYNGIAGWKWLFIIEGIWTIVVGIAFFLFFPANVDRPKPFFTRSWRYFDDSELHILKTRLIIDDPTKDRNVAPITLNDIKSTFSQWRLWIHVLISLAGLQSNTALQTYGPSIVKSFGFSTVRANALSSVGPWGTVIIALSLAFLSDWYPVKALWLFIDLTAIFVLTGVLYASKVSWGKWRRYAVFEITAAPQQCFHPINTAWMSLNARTPQERSISMAMIIMAANVVGITGSQIMRANDSPLYHKGFLAIIFTSAFAWGLVVFQYLQYKQTNKRALKLGDPKFLYTP